MTLYPNCKINIGLRVVRKREDGYHDLQTIFYPVYGLHDTLEVNSKQPPSPLKGDDDLHHCTFHAEGIAVDCAEEDNLIVRCYRQMAARYPQIGPVSVKFTKQIPFGAGLGGGSSDAAHMAIALNEIFELGLTKDQLVQEVRPLGADCPFFIYNTPCFAEGIGDILTPIDLSLKGKRLVMIKPDVAVSTRDAYAGIQISRDSPSLLLGSKPRFTDFVNDFETTVFRKYPILADIKQRLLDAGAYYAAMSGSGSTIFGLFETDSESGANPHFGVLDEELTSMVIFDDTLG